ncbi:MAG: ABC transporter permease subunit [Ruminococcaceae bacterium]|nr:ABC transporter permease subunit [Oscillospiraceae bacterium]
MKRAAKNLLALVFWLGVWAFAAWRMGQPLLLPSPIHVAGRLWHLMGEGGFWLTTAASLGRVLLGVVLSVVLGVALAALTEAFSWLNDLLSPLLTVIKSTPVASFIILAILWMGRDQVPVFIVILMALPVIWANVATGIRTTDPGLLQMAKVYQFPLLRRLRRIWVPSVMPHFLSACRTSLGLAWKAGIAAEVLTVPANSIGKMLYTSKLNFQIEELFAWTLVVIVLSLVIEQGLLSLLGRVSAAYNTRGGTGDG